MSAVTVFIPVEPLITPMMIQSSLAQAGAAAAHTATTMVIPMAVTAATVVGVAAGTAMLTYGAYRALSRLQTDYQTTLTAFERRAQDTQAAQQSQADEAHTTAQESQALAALTQVRAQVDVTQTFVQHRLTQLAAQLAGVHRTAPELHQEFTSIQEELTANPHGLGKQLARLVQLSAAVSAARHQQVDPLALVAEEVLGIREALAAPVLDDSTGAALRLEVEGQVQALLTQLPGQQALVRQGLAMLRLRIARELQTRVDHLLTRAQAQTQVRNQVGEALAHLQAVRGQNLLPELAAQATGLHDELLAWIAQPDGEDAALTALATQAGELFQTCTANMETYVRACYVADQAADVLRTMGYRVAPLASSDDTPSRDYLAAVGNKVGLHLSVDASGRLTSEMVALTAEVQEVDLERQASVCGLVDRVLDGLAARQCGVREQFRKHHTPGEALPLLAWPMPAAAAPQAAPRAREVGE
jgi:hypothetical protein